MNEKLYEKIIDALLEKITRLENDAFIKDYNNEQLRAENVRLNELLTPTAKGDLKDE